jgi:hypothetical protein
LKEDAVKKAELYYARIALLRDLGFPIVNVPPYPVAEPEWRKIGNKDIQILYTQSPEDPTIFLVRTERKRGKELVLDERLVYAKSEQALRDYLTPKGSLTSSKGSQTSSGSLLDKIRKIR